MNIILALYLLVFGFLVWKNFRLGIFCLILTLPSYVVRYEIFKFPTTLLELSFGVLFFVWILKYFKTDIKEIGQFVKQNRIFSLFFGLFFIASILGILISDEWYKSLGQWRAYFFEPMLFFVMMIGRLGEEKNKISAKAMAICLSFSTLSISVLAILQKFIPALYPPYLWGTETFGRPTAFFYTPNAIGLYAAPILILAAVLLVFNNQESEFTFKKLFSFNFLVIFLGLVAIALSLSQGAWIALAAGILVFIYLSNYKKIALSVLVLGVILCLAITPMRQAVLFKDKAGENRLALWKITTNYLVASPKNFTFGAGIRQWFRKVQKPFFYQEDYGIERLIYPHNFIFNFWSEIGLLGMVSFLGLLSCLFKKSFDIYKNKKYLGAGLVAMLTVFTIHGLVDVPYFKNDLAFLFWFLALIVFAFNFELNKKQK